MALPFIASCMAPFVPPLARHGARRMQVVAWAGPSPPAAVYKLVGPKPAQQALPR